MSDRMTRSRGRAIGLALALGAFGAAMLAQEPATPPSPAQIANRKERERIMAELKIPAIPPGASSSSPATYDEAQANPYPDLPDPLTLRNGRKVTSAASR